MLLVYAGVCLCYLVVCVNVVLFAFWIFVLVGGCCLLFSLFVGGMGWNQCHFGLFACGLGLFFIWFLASFCLFVLY